MVPDFSNILTMSFCLFSELISDSWSEYSEVDSRLTKRMLLFKVKAEGEGVTPLHFPSHML